MGLDITAYSNLKHVGEHTEEWCEDEDHVSAYAYECFPQSYRGLPILRSTASGDTTLVHFGCFERMDSTQTHAFRAGSYLGYGAWRADLSRQFNPDTDPARPFFELIWFADNEGCIGQQAAADLLADFRDHAKRYAPDLPGWAEIAVQKYQDWTDACELAANGGLIRFH